MVKEQNLENEVATLVADINHFIDRAELAGAGAAYYVTRSSQDGAELMREIHTRFLSEFHGRMHKLHQEIKEFAEATKNNRLIQLCDSLPGTWDSSRGTEALLGWAREHAEWFAYTSFWL